MPSGLGLLFLLGSLALGIWMFVLSWKMGREDRRGKRR